MGKYSLAERGLGNTVLEVAVKISRASRLSCCPVSRVPFIPHQRAGLQKSTYRDKPFFAISAVAHVINSGGGGNIELL